MQDFVKGATLQGRRGQRRSDCGVRMRFRQRFERQRIRLSTLGPRLHAPPKLNMKLDQVSYHADGPDLMRLRSRRRLPLTPAGILIFHSKS